MTLIDPCQIFAASLAINIVEIGAVCIALSFLRAHGTQVVEIRVGSIIVELMLRGLVLYHRRIGAATRSALITCIVVSVN